MKKPKWVIEKEQARRKASAETVWLFGLHAVRDALLNPRRDRLRLIVTQNALDRLGDAVAASALRPRSAIPAALTRRWTRSRSTRAPRSRSSRSIGDPCPRLSFAPAPPHRASCFSTG